MTDPQEFLARVFIHVSEPNKHLVHFYGAYANRVRQTYREHSPPDTDARTVPCFVLETARLLEESEQKDAARAEYERFLELWKNADEDLPELREARAYLGR